MPERLEDAMRQYFNDEPEDRRLAESHRGILQEVRRTPAIGMLDLALRLGVSPPTCSFLIEELASLGYVEVSGRRSGPFDCELKLTDQGRAFFASPKASALSRQFCRTE